MISTSSILKYGMQSLRCCSVTVATKPDSGGFLLLLKLSVPIVKRDLHSQNLSKNLQLTTNNKVSESRNYQVLDASQPRRPLTLMYSWTLAKDKNVMKYAKYHLERGIDVLKIRTFPLDLLYPKTGGQVIAEQTLKFLVNNPSYNPILVHGMSVGAYTFAELLIKILSDMPKYESVKERFVGQIWDSVVDVCGLPSGLSKAITSNKTLQLSLENIFKFHLRLNYNIATVYYNKASTIIHNNFVGVPGLFIYSKVDPVSPPEMNENVFKTWPGMGIPVYTKCFEDSRHCCHLMEHQREYADEIAAFMEKVGLLQPSERRAAIAAAN